MAYPLQTSITPNVTTGESSDAEIVHAKLNAYIDVVSDFGAAGDGTTDDTAAIVAANAAAAGAGHGVVFPPGTYKYTDAITIPAGVTWSGGPESVLLASTASIILMSQDDSAIVGLTIRRALNTNPLVRVTGARSTISGVSFDGVGATYTGTVVDVRSGGDDCIITGCIFDSVKGPYGVLFEATDGSPVLRATVTGNHFVNFLTTTASAALGMVTNVKGFTITGNQFSMGASCVATAIQVATSGAASVLEDGCIANNRITGLNCSDAQSSGAGIQVAKTASGPTVKNVTVTGNVIRVATGATTIPIITMVGCEHCTVVGNTVDLSGLAATCYAGIEVILSLYCTVQGNTVHASTFATVGIVIDASSYCAVTGNTIKAANSVGIHVLSGGSDASTPASDNAVTGNVIVLPPTGAVDGIRLKQQSATGACDRNVVVGNAILGNAVVNADAVALDNSGGGTLDRSLIGMNTATSVTNVINASGDTNTLSSGSTWNRS